MIAGEGAMHVTTSLSSSKLALGYLPGVRFKGSIGRLESMCRSLEHTNRYVVDIGTLMFNKPCPVTFTEFVNSAIAPLGFVLARTWAAWIEQQTATEAQKDQLETNLRYIRLDRCPYARVALRRNLGTLVILDHWAWVFSLPHVWSCPC